MLRRIGLTVLWSLVAYFVSFAAVLAIGVIFIALTGSAFDDQNIARASHVVLAAAYGAVLVVGVTRFMRSGQWPGSSRVRIILVFVVTFALTALQGLVIQRSEIWQATGATLPAGDLLAPPLVIGLIDGVILFVWRP